MKSSIELLRVDALALMGLFLSDGVRQCFGIDEIDVSTDPAKVACRTSCGCLQRTIVTAIDVVADVDLTIRMSEFDDAPRRFEGPRSTCRHARQRRRNLRDCPRLRKLGLETDVADLSWTQKTDQASADVCGKGSSQRIDVHPPRRACQHALVGQALHHELEVLRVLFPE